LTVPVPTSSDVSVSRADVEAAARRVNGRIRTTPLVRTEPGALGQQESVHLKLESLQVTGAFKARGAFNKMLCGPLPAAGVAAASGGNHGVAVADAAAQLGCPAEIFVPPSCPEVKRDRFQALGATVHVVGTFYEEAFAACRERAAESGARLVHSYDDPEVVAGQGTIGLELDAQLQGLDTVLAPVGGGGLAGGLCAWFGRRVRVVGVEPHSSCSMHAALAAERPLTVEVGGVAVDSLGPRRVGDVPFGLCRESLADAVLVPDEAIVAAMRALWEELRIVAEPGGATALAALLSGAYQPAAGERVCVIVSGGNRDPAVA
jgi:threonine dehydratase